MRAFRLLLLAALTSGLPIFRWEVAAAQQPDRLPDGIALGGSMDRFLYEGTGITSLSFRLSHLRANTAGTELGVSLFPQTLQYGAILLAPDLGAAYNISLPGATLLVKAGGSGILGLGQGFAAVPGLHLGTALIIRAGPRAGVRIDAVRHYYLYGGETEGIWSVGLGLTGLPRASP